MEILFGENVNIEIIKKIMQLDEDVYSPHYAGEFKNMYDRWLACKDSLIIAMDGNTVAGYICYLCICDSLFDEIINTGEETRDDDILPEELSPYTDNNHIFIISIVVREEYRDGYTIRLLEQQFAKHLKKLDEKGKTISDISAICISDGGVKCAKRMGLSSIRNLSDGNVVYLASRDNVKKFLNSH